MKIKNFISKLSLLLLFSFLLSALLSGCNFYNYEAKYPEKHIDFKGNYVDWRVEYNELSIDLAEFQKIDQDGKQKKNPIKRIFTDCPFIFHWYDKSCKIIDLKPSDVKAMGAEMEKSYYTIGVIRSPSGYNPPYYLSFLFFGNQILALGVSVQNPPDPTMRAPEECPFSFSFGKAKKVQLPITHTKLKEYLGTPPKTDMSLIPPAF